MTTFLLRRDTLDPAGTVHAYYACQVADDRCLRWDTACGAASWRRHVTHDLGDGPMCSWCTCQSPRSSVNEPPPSDPVDQTGAPPVGRLAAHAEPARSRPTGPVTLGAPERRMDHPGVRPEERRAKMSKQAEVSPKAAGLGCLVVVAIVLVVVLISVFSRDKPTSPTGSIPSATSAVSANDPAIKQAAYLATLRIDGIRGTDQTLIQAGHATCDALDSGLPMTQVMLIAATSGSLTPEQGGMVVGGAVATWCPKYQPEIDNFSGH